MQHAAMQLAGAGRALAAGGRPAGLRTQVFPRVLVAPPRITSGPPRAWLSFEHVRDSSVAGAGAEPRRQRGPRSALARSAAWRALSHGHSHGHSHGDEPSGPPVTVTFIQEKDGVSKTVTGYAGMNVLRVAQAHEVELEGACECSLACSTCHVILEDELFDRLPEPSDDENDMLDMAFGLSETSRLGCQIELTEDMEGAVFRIPSATRNMYVDGHVPKPH